jgi:hypothetical protein
MSITSRWTCTTVKDLLVNSLNYITCYLLIKSDNLNPMALIMNSLVFKVFTAVVMKI